MEHHRDEDDVYGGIRERDRFSCATHVPDAVGLVLPTCVGEHLLRTVDTHNGVTRYPSVTPCASIHGITGRRASHAMQSDRFLPSCSSWHDSFAATRNF
jgi:hypothetical protein